MTAERLAIFGGQKAFNGRLKITEPTLPDFDDIKEGTRKILESRMVTASENVRNFENEIKEYTGAKNAAAVSACTTGLLISMRTLDLKGEVIMPSFTFMASGHALLWNNLRPRFVDIDPQTFNISPAEVEKAVTKDTCAILGLHIFGNPAEVRALEKTAEEHNLKLIFDSAHALGSESGGKKIGTFGDCEVFSLSPTKTVTACEGGLVLTKHDDLHSKIVMARDYGKTADYDSVILGLNARMAEFNALIAINSLRMLERSIERRNRIADIYRKRLEKLPGISFQEIKSGNRSTFKDFAITIDHETFLLTRNQLRAVLEAENIEVRTYFDPPLHRQTLYKTNEKLPVTDAIASSILCLPLYSHMPEIFATTVCDVIAAAYENSESIEKVIG